MARLPILVHPIPEQTATVGQPYELDITQHIQNPSGEKSLLFFSVTSEDGFPLPMGLYSTSEGRLRGIPKKESYRPQGYILYITVQNEAQGELVAAIRLMIEEAPELDEVEGAINLSEADKEALEERLLHDLFAEAEMVRDQKKVWSAIALEGVIPEIQTIFDRPVTSTEMYYMLERFAHIVLWDIDNLDKPGELRSIFLGGASHEHFFIYDRGSCLEATPKKLFDHARSLQHGIDTAKAIAREAFARGWRVEFGGFDKMVRAAWVEMQCLAQKHQRGEHDTYYFPSAQDIELLQQEQQKLKR